MGRPKARHQEKTRCEVLITPCHNIKGGGAFIRPTGLAGAGHLHIIPGLLFSCRS